MRQIFNDEDNQSSKNQHFHHDKSEDSGTCSDCVNIWIDVALSLNCRHALHPLSKLFFKNYAELNCHISVFCSIIMRVDYSASL